jgi:hypothetical protein
MRGAPCDGSSASATATPIASDRPDQSARAIDSASEKVSAVPRSACQCAHGVRGRHSAVSGGRMAKGAGEG